MTQWLPTNLQLLFSARAPPPFLPPPIVPSDKRSPHYDVIFPYLERSKEYKEDGYEPSEPRLSRMEKSLMKKMKAEEAIRTGLLSWDPSRDPLIEGDPYKTLFVARLSYETDERALGKIFDLYGPIRRIRIVHDKITGKPRGYAFIEYERERDMRAAYKDGEGLKIDGRRVVVDVERGRTVKNWRPRKFGGGLGTVRLYPGKKRLEDRLDSPLDGRRGDGRGDSRGDRPGGDRDRFDRGGDRGGGDRYERGGDRGGDRHGLDRRGDRFERGDRGSFDRRDGDRGSFDQRGSFDRRDDRRDDRVRGGSFDRREDFGGRKPRTYDDLPTTNGPEEGEFRDDRKRKRDSKSPSPSKRQRDDGRW